MKGTRGLATYLLWQLPGWIVAAVVLASAMEAFGLPVAVATILLVLYVGKDLALFPVMRAVFRPSASSRYVGATGVAVEPLAPAGYIRVGGELWKAQTSGARVAPGTPVVVRAARGLTLLVEPREPR
jgi:membrane protein implicated in regulation of membrane protease activity